MKRVKMIIRELQQNDLQECAKLFCDTYSKPPYNENWDFNNAYSYLKRFWEIDPDNCYIAAEETSILGCSLSYAYPWHNDMHYHIQELFVRESHRKKGIARKLLGKLCKNNDPVNAWVIAKLNAEAATFYEKMGFSKKGPYHFFHGTINT